MSLVDVLKLIQHNPKITTVVIVLLLSFVEVSKIKINPWSSIGKLFGKFLGISAVSNKLDALEKKVDENQATTIRVRILQFENELQEGRKKSKDSWDQVMDDIRRYELYTANHPEFKNNITTASTKHIMHEYGILLEERAWTTGLTNNTTER